MLRILEAIDRRTVFLEPAHGAHLFHRQKFLQARYDTAGMHRIRRDTLPAIAQMQAQSKQRVGAFGLSIGVPFVVGAPFKMNVVKNHIRTFVASGTQGYDTGIAGLAGRAVGRRRQNF